MARLGVRQLRPAVDELVRYSAAWRSFGAREPRDIPARGTQCFGSFAAEEARHLVAHAEHARPGVAATEVHDAHPPAQADRRLIARRKRRPKVEQKTSTRVIADVESARRDVGNGGPPDVETAGGARRVARPASRRRDLLPRLPGRERHRRDDGE